MLASPRMAGPERFPGDDAALIEAVRCANVPTLMLVMVHLTGDTDWLRGAIKPRRATPQQMDGGLSDADASEVRERALAVLRDYRDSNRVLPPLPEPAVLAEMMQFSLGQPIAPEYVPMMLDDMALASGGTRDVPGGQAVRGASDLHVVVIGAGMSGVLAAIALHKAGFASRWSRRTRTSAAPGSRTATRAAASTCRTISTRIRSSRTTTGPTITHAATSYSRIFERVATKHGVRERIAFRDRGRGRALRRDAAGAWEVTLRDRRGDRDAARATR